jgi:ABC-type multidrug transport system ATPase subunit
MEMMAVKMADDLACAPVVEFDDVHMIFSGKVKKPVRALNSMSLKIPKGSIVGLLGPNGCGKTTAVSCIIGLLFPQKGKIKLWGQPSEKIFRQPNGHQIGVVLEDTRLPPFMTVKKALISVCKLRDVPVADIRSELARIVDTTGIESLLHLRINGLSKGQARRVGVAAALIHDPPLLILDEPASGLDVTARIEFNDLVRSLCDGNRTMLITSHLLSDVENTCTHIAIMQSGCVNIFGKTQDLVFQDSDDKIDIFIHKKHIQLLDKLDLSYENCSYAQLVKLVQPDDCPAYDTLGRLSNHRIVPTRIEPRENLIKYYMSVTGNEG